uniref:Uncharacterized protein n=1 Tax=Anopheles dirus TaxID=7168 RepID=A0A182NX19_9DIPT
MFYLVSLKLDHTMISPPCQQAKLRRSSSGVSFVIVVRLLALGASNSSFCHYRVDQSVHSLCLHMYRH